MNELTTTIEISHTQMEEPGLNPATVSSITIFTFLSMKVGLGNKC